MHARTLNTSNFGNASRKLVFHGLDVTHLLHELAGGHGALLA